MRVSLETMEELRGDRGVAGDVKVSPDATVPFEGWEWVGGPSSATTLLRKM